MRFAALVSCIVLAASAADLAGEAAFKQGMKAFAAKDWDKALDSLETALTADPDNIQYGSEYRQVNIARAQSLHGKDGKSEDYERPIKFFERLVISHPNAANAYLNFGLAYVDKLPTQELLGRATTANAALSQFTKSIDLRPSWIGYYTRGTSYLYWPKLFDRTKLGIADLQTALKMQTAGPKKPYYFHTWIALGDAYWKSDDMETARSTWAEGLKQFPNTPALEERLAKQGEDLRELIAGALDPKKRVDTNLKDLWLNP